MTMEKEDGPFFWGGVQQPSNLNAHPNKNSCSASPLSGCRSTCRRWTSTPTSPRSATSSRCVLRQRGRPCPYIWISACSEQCRHAISPPPPKTKQKQVITDKSQRQLVRELDASLPRYVLLDKIRFSQLIMNLTSNAAKVKSSR